MKNNKVVINTFKSTGKWYDTLTLYTSTPVYLCDEIVKEAEIQFKQLKDFNYTIYISNEGESVINHRLIINKL